MNEPILITEEELEYYTKPQILTEGNAENVHYFSEEEYIRDSQGCITIEEFSNMIDEAIRRKIPNP